MTAGIGGRMVAGFAMLVVVLPFLWVLRVALKPEESYIGDPGGLGGGFTLDNFEKAWRGGNLGDALLNSVSIVSVGAIVATVLATLTGFALAKLEFPGRRLLVVVSVLAIGVPLAAIVIPLFDEGLRLGYADSRLGLGLVYGAVFASWGTLFMLAYYRGLPDELLESARIDGANLLQLFLRIAVPLARPAVVTVLVINVFIQWSELILALVLLPDPSKQTATVAIATFSTQFRTGGPLTAAGMVIAAAPILVVFVLGQRSLRAGVYAGAVKS